MNEPRHKDKEQLIEEALERVTALRDFDEQRQRSDMLLGFKLGWKAAQDQSASMKKPA